MTVIALVSAKGSPGCTTLALALAHVWPRRVLLAECDPAGGDIAAGYLAGCVPPDRGLLDLSVAARRAPIAEVLDEQATALDEAGARRVLLGLRDPRQAAALAGWWDPLATAWQQADTGDGPGFDVLADCGRLGHAHAPDPVLARADLVVLVLRRTLRSIAIARAAAAALRADTAEAHGGPPPSRPGGARRMVAVTIGEGSYGTNELAAALGVGVLEVPLDRRAAAVFSHGATAPRGFMMSPLIRGARTLTGPLLLMTEDSDSERTYPGLATHSAVASGADPVVTTGGAR